MGFALESFDVAGGWRDRYRSLGKTGDRVKGIGKNGHSFKFRLGKHIDPAGELNNGQRFDNILDLKKLLLKDERAIAQNLLHRLIVYATGAPITFGDRSIVESVLDQCEDTNYGVRSLIHALIQSKLFLNK